MIYLELFLGFLKVGCFSFGGAYAAIPLIREVVLDYGWISDETLSYMIAVSESTPGPIMINLATYIGSTQGGFTGAVLATLATVLPAFFIILLLTASLKMLLKNAYVQAAMRGMEPCIIGIIIATGAYMIFHNGIVIGEKVVLDIKALGLTILLAGCMYLYQVVKKQKMSPLVLIGVSACLGMLIF